MRLKERNHIFWTSWREICKVSPCVGSTGPLLLKEKGYINMRPLFTMKYLTIKYSKLLKSFQKVIQYNTFSFSKLYLFEKIPLWKGTCLNSWGTIWVPFWTKKGTFFRPNVPFYLVLLFEMVPLFTKRDLFSMLKHYALSICLQFYIEIAHIQNICCIAKSKDFYYHFIWQ